MRSDSTLTQKNSHIYSRRALNYPTRTVEKSISNLYILHTVLREGKTHMFALTSRFTAILVLIPTFIALWMPNSTYAQMEYMAEAMQPEYMSRDLIVFAEGLNLDDTQEVIVEAMFDSYEDDFQNGWSATQERLNQIAEEIRGNPTASTKETLEPVLGALSDWLIEKRRLDEGLLENVQAILVEQQRLLWPTFSQRLYREKHMSRGRLSGESVDLFQIVRDSDLPPAAETLINDHLEEYGSALDLAMRNRDAILRGNPKKLFDNILSGNAQRSPDLVEGLIKARVEVRDLNDRYIDLISCSLSGSDAEDFRLRALKRGYTRIYRRTPAQRLFRQAAEHEAYDEGLRAQIIQLEFGYLQELEVINFEILDKTRSHEPAMHLHRELAGQVRKEGGTPQKLDDPTRALYKEREELGKRYIEMLRALLTDEQFLELDGSRRWVPRNEMPVDPTDPSSDRVNSIDIKSGKMIDIEKANEEKEKKKRDASGTSNQQKGSGMRGPDS